MTPHQIKKKSMAWAKVRTLTKNCTLETWQSWVAEIDADGKPHYDIVTKDMFGIKRGFEFFRCAKTIPRKWLVKIRVRCQDDNGQTYIEETELEADNIKLDDFHDLFKAEKKAMLDACNPHHIRDVGWWAKALT